MFQKYYKKSLTDPGQSCTYCMYCQIFIGTKARIMLFIRSHSDHIFIKEYLSLLVQRCYRGLQLLVCKWSDLSWDGTEFWCFWCILMGINEWLILQASSAHSALSLRQLSRNSCTAHEVLSVVIHWFRKQHFFSCLGCIRPCSCSYSQSNKYNQGFHSIYQEYTLWHWLTTGGCSDKLAEKEQC